MSQPTSLLAALALLVLAAPARPDDTPPQATAHGLRLPAGFEVTEFADSTLAADIHCLALDPKGRPVVSGRGYVRLLVDDDGDGRADKALDFKDAPKDGAMGLFWQKNDLYCVGDGGLRVYRDAGGVGRGRPSELLFACRTGSEHLAHAVNRGPDGWLYLLVGDQTGITKKHVTLPTSPVKDPVAGCVLRFPPDGKGCEVFADGFRNAYAMDWNPDGELFTYDSDNERCVSLPWYEPTRCYHVRPGARHGWLAPQFCSTWRCPPYFFDVAAPVCTLGRGSPTGVVCYRHTQFPERYRGGLFLLDWTFGQVHFVRLEKRVATYRGAPEVFLKSVGDNGFAPVAAAVHPVNGDLYVAIGGRGTRGAVYRIRYPAGLKSIDPTEVARLQPRPRPPAKRVEVVAGDSRLDAVRSAQLALGDVGAARAKGTVWEGYTARDGGAVTDELRQAFPTGDATLDRELSRVLAMAEDGDPATLSHVVGKLSARSDPVEDIHYLIVAARLKAARSGKATVAVADALIGLDRKLDERKMARDRNWALRVAELHAGLAERDPRLNAALLAHRDFGRPDHAVFCRAKGFDRAGAAERFLARSKEAGFAWNGELIGLVGELPAARSLPVLRSLWGDHGLDEAILPHLARHAAAADRERFLVGLTSASLGTLGVALGAVEKLPAPAGDARRDEAFALARALRQLAPGKEEDKIRGRLLARLSKLAVTRLATPEAAVAWVRKEYPGLAARLADGDGVDVESWKKRLARIDWDKAEPTRGQGVYTKASCAACHSGAAALGPDLRGVTGRFSRDDLFTAILRPGKDVSPRYRTTQLTTTAGQTYQGIIVYEAVDSVLMLTGPGQSIRVANTQVAEKRLTASSLMPAGLLDRLTDDEVRDLYGYLKSLK
jgi:putative heme-binding domain-containing protein